MNKAIICKTESCLYFDCWSYTKVGWLPRKLTLILLVTDKKKQKKHWHYHYCMTISMQQKYKIIGNNDKQGKSEGFESCDRPIVRKRPIWVKIGDVLSRVTLKFAGWPWKTIGHLSFAVSSFVQHFIAIGEFKLELLSGNAQFGSNLTIFRAVWPWNLTYDLDKK